jgi:DNA invertase Pin-like site-specific DNA recombinase
MRAEHDTPHRMRKRLRSGEPCVNRKRGYFRVSTQGQAQDGVSLDAQEAKVRAWTDLNGSAEAIISRDEGLSGKRADNRPGLQEALDAVDRGDALIVYSLSRLSRSTKDTLALADTLSKKDADLVSLSEKIDTTTATGKMVFRMLAGLSEFERDQVSDRTRFALAHKKANKDLLRRLRDSMPWCSRRTADGSSACRCFEWGGSRNSLGFCGIGDRRGL